eukprot:3206207-Prymnesium_polylepis.1
MQPLHVSLTIHSRTSFGMWGRVTHPEQCVASAAETASPVSTNVREETSVTFTACDVDKIPVNHRLPTPYDPRDFEVLLIDVHGKKIRGRWAPEVEYSGDGVYTARFKCGTSGQFGLNLQLDDVDMGRIEVEAICPNDLVVVSGGRCGCQAGFFQLTAWSDCEMCEPGK